MFINSTICVPVGINGIQNIFFLTGTHILYAIYSVKNKYCISNVILSATYIDIDTAAMYMFLCVCNCYEAYTYICKNVSIKMNFIHSLILLLSVIYHQNPCVFMCLFWFESPIPFLIQLEKIFVYLNHLGLHEIRHLSFFYVSDFIKEKWSPFSVKSKVISHPVFYCESV